MAISNRLTNSSLGTMVTVYEIKYQVTIVICISPRLHNDFIFCFSSILKSNRIENRLNPKAELVEEHWSVQ